MCGRPAAEFQGLALDHTGGGKPCRVRVYPGAKIMSFATYP